MSRIQGRFQALAKSKRKALIPYITAGDPHPSLTVALTGTEAIANGVPAFQPPESKNAGDTMIAMAILLAVLFIGITFLAVNFGITHIDLPEKQTVISQVASRVYGAGSIPFYLFQAFTALLLVLVEAVIEERAQEAAALRDPEHVGPVDLARARVPLPRAPPAQEGRGVANRGEAETDQRGILGPVVALVDPPGLEAAVEGDRARVGEAPRSARHRDRGGLRVLAHVSQDPALLDAFRSGADIHRRTAAAGFAVEESAVTREQRDVAKMLNFGIIYGMSDFGLAWRMQMPREEAQRFIDEVRAFTEVDKGESAKIKDGELDLAGEEAEPSEEVHVSLAESAVRDAVETLPDREREVVKLRYGMDGDPDPKSLEEIGRTLGLTRERVRQIETRALQRLAERREVAALGETA